MSVRIDSASAAAIEAARRAREEALRRAREEAARRAAAERAAELRRQQAIEAKQALRKAEQAARLETNEFKGPNQPDKVEMSGRGAEGPKTAGELQAYKIAIDEVRRSSKAEGKRMTAGEAREVVDTRYGDWVKKAGEALEKGVTPEELRTSFAKATSGASALASKAMFEPKTPGEAAAYKLATEEVLAKAEANGTKMTKAQARELVSRYYSDWVETAGKAVDQGADPKKLKLPSSESDHGPNLPPLVDKMVEAIFGRSGPELLHLSEGWTPQGQGYDAATGEVISAYYNEDHQVLLSYQDKKSGDENLKVILGGKGDIPAPTHGGGVATDGNFVYVADTDEIYTYSKADILAAKESGEPVEPVSVIEAPADTTDPETGIGLVANASFMTVKDGYAYVGAYSEDEDGKAGAVWRYEIDPATGELDEGSRQGPIRAPDRAQGMTVVDGAMLFTTGSKQLFYQPFDEEAFTADLEQRVDISNGQVDSWAQGLNVIDGELWVTYESGSLKYDGEEGRQHIHRIPLDELGLDAAGITAEDLQG